ncbi:uncharacterized protein LOC132286320 [Cornus florida]|uniref:uncharacterized protein LOC132286320 n=1 Tax=Cornus florida TaxID=4283 RepID=UPI002899A179|nr:uncharacterized protein LOC132286320 [Cornus florida]XP_059644624.1 uncharacterized protein LOC132286320 [Cornus florida]
MSRDSNDRLPMENFRAAVMEMASRHPSKPLTEARKCLIDKRIREFFAHTPSPPDHPPHSAMIHGALQELNEEGGSSEESISNFIRKEYKELPWAHSIFLNHHLGKLCVSGEIVLTRDNSYLLAGAIMKQKPSSTRHSKRKELKRKQSKKRRRELGCPCNKQEIEAEYHLKEQMEVIEELNKALEDNTEMVDKQNQVPIGEMLQSCDDGEKGDGRKLKVLPVQSLGPIMEEEIGAEYQLEESREGIEELNQALEHYTFDKQNQVSFDEMLQSCDDGEKGDGGKLKLLPVESLGPIMEEEIEDEYQLKEPMEVIEEQNEALEDEKDDDISEMLQSCDDREKGDCWKLKVLPVEALGSIMEEEIESEYLLKEPMEGLKEPMEGIEEQNQALEYEKDDDISEILQSCDDGEKGDGRKLKLLPVEALGPIMEEEVESEYQLKELMEGLKEPMEGIEEQNEALDYEKDGDISEMLQSCDAGEKGEGRKLKVLPVESLGPIMEEEIEAEYQLKEPMEGIEEQNQALEDEKNDESLKLLSVESLEPIMEEEKKESSEEEHPMKSPGEENSDIVVLQPEQQLDLPLPEKISELKSTELSYTPVQLEQRTQEKPQCRQLRPRPPKAGSLTDTSMTESLPSQNQHEVQGTQEKPHRRKLRPRPPKAGSLTDTSMTESLPSQHQHEEQRTQEKPQRRQLRPRPPKAGSLTDTSMTESLPSQHQHEEQRTQEKPRRRQLRPRPPKAGSLAAASTTESLPRQQEQLEQVEQPERRGPGRPKKQREQLEQVEQPERRGCGRPRKQQEEPKQQAQPKRRGRGRPPKAQTN